MSKRKKKEGYLFIYLTDEELSVYSPKHFDTLKWAYDQLHKDCDQIARHEKRKPEDILQSCIRSLEDRILELYWQEVSDDRKRRS